MDLWGFKYSDRKLLMPSLQLCGCLFVDLDIVVVTVFRVHSVVDSRNRDEWSFWLVSKLVGRFRWSCEASRLLIYSLAGQAIKQKGWNTFVGVLRLLFWSNLWCHTLPEVKIDAPRGILWLLVSATHLSSITTLLLIKTG